MQTYVFVLKNYYTIRLLLIQRDDVDDKDVEDGCLLLAIGAATGAAALLTLAIIVATIACIYHRQPCFANKRVSTCYRA